MKFLLFMFACALISASVHGVVFSRCQLAKQLLRNKFPRKHLDNWVCLVEAESSRRTSTIGPQNTDGSVDYGLFQINGKYWCEVGRRGKGCNVDCNELLSDNIHAASQCALRIYDEHGFSGWYGWQRRCQNRSLPSIWAQCGF